MSVIQITPSRFCSSARLPATHRADDARSGHRAASTRKSPRALSQPPLELWGMIDPSGHQAVKRAGSGKKPLADSGSRVVQVHLVVGVSLTGNDPQQRIFALPSLGSGCRHFFVRERFDSGDERVVGITGKLADLG